MLEYPGDSHRLAGSQVQGDDNPVFLAPDFDQGSIQPQDPDLALLLRDGPDIRPIPAAAFGGAGEARCPGNGGAASQPPLALVGSGYTARIMPDLT